MRVKVFILLLLQLCAVITWAYAEIITEANEENFKDLRTNVMNNTKSGEIIDEGSYYEEWEEHEGKFQKCSICTVCLTYFS